MQTIPNLPVTMTFPPKMQKLIIGGVQGKVDEYWKILQKNPTVSSIQVGDFGFKKEHEWLLKNVDTNRHKINFGNNDYYPYLKQSHSLGDFSYSPEMGIFTTRGAFSIDASARKVGVNWFYEEQLTYQLFNQVVSSFNINEPKIMISHDCPEEIRKRWFNSTQPTMTSTALQVMFEVHQPDIWIFGHHHQSKSETVNGTKFICLAELETIII